MALELFKPNSPRVKNFPEFLRDIIIAKMQEIDPGGFKEAVKIKDGNYLTGLANDAYTALKVREKTGNNDGVLVEATQKVGGGRKGWAWCLYQGQACVGIAEILTGNVSLMPYTGHVGTCFAKARKVPGLFCGEIKDAQYGDQLGYVSKGGPGHTENFKIWIDEPKTMHCNGGNTTGGTINGKVVREGGGSYLTSRKASFWNKGLIRAFPVVAVPVKVKIPKLSDIPKYGERSDRVASMQKAYNAWAKGSLNAQLDVDAQFGPKTKKAIANFQKLNGLAGSGIPGKKTMEKLGLKI